MNDFNWESPTKMGNPMFMGSCWLMAAQKEYMEGMMKKYMPIQYQMIKTMQAAMEKGR